MGIILVSWWRLVSICLTAPNDAALSHFAIFFAVGILSYFIWKNVNNFKNHVNVWTLSILICSLSIAHMAIGIWAIVFGSALLARVRDNDGGPILRMLSLYPMQFMGRISYSLYLVHMIPMYLILYALSRTSLPREAQIAILFTGTLVGSILLAAFTTRFIEGTFYRSRARSRATAAKAADIR